MSSPGQIVGGVLGAVIGAFVGYPMLGAQIGLMAGGLVDPPKGPKIEGPRLNDLNVQLTGYGNPIPRLYGTTAVSGTIFWVENNALKETSNTQTQGGKGGGGGAETTTYSYSATFALGLCRGPISHIKRVWISGKLVYDASNTNPYVEISQQESGFNFRLYKGTSSQLPDPRMQAALGVNNTPAYRGLAYLLVEDFDLSNYGNSLMGAQFKVEVVEPQIADIWRADLLSTTVDPYGSGHFRAAWFDGTEQHILFVAGDSSNLHFTVERSDRYGRNTGSNAFDLPTSPYQYLNVYPCGQTDIPCFSKFNYGAGVVYLLGFDGTLYRTLTWGVGAEPWRCGIRVDDDEITLMYVANDGGIAYWDADGNYHLVSIPEMHGASDVAFSANEIFIVDNSGLIGDSIGLFLYVIDIETGTYTTISHDGIPYFHIDPSSPLCYAERDGTCYIQNRGEFYRYIPGALSLEVVGMVPYYLEGGAAVEPGSWVGASPDAEHQVSYLYHRNGLFYVANLVPAPTSELDFRLEMAFGHSGDAFRSLRSIVEDECELSRLLTLDDLDASDLAETVKGYRVAQAGSIRAALEPLRAAWPFDVIQDGYQIKFIRRGKSSVASVAYDDLGAVAGNDKPGVRLTEAREMDSQLPVKVSVTYLDYYREYDTGEQYSARTTTDAVNELRVELPIVLVGDEAAGMAETLNYAAWVERYDLSFVLPPTYAALQPADVITINGDGYTREVRIDSLNLLPDGRLEVAAKFNQAATYTPSAVGETGAYTGQVLVPYALPSDLALLDIPCVDSATMNSPGFLAAAGAVATPWPGATLVRSPDGGQTWKSVQGFSGNGSVIGWVVSPPGTPTSFQLLDAKNTLNLRRLSVGDLASVSEAQLYNGANHFAIGAHGRWEIIAAKTVVEESNGSFTLSNLMRGRFGTEQYAGTHAVNDAIVLLDPADVRFIGLDTLSLGMANQWKLVTQGAIADTVDAQSFTCAGVSLECLAPIRLAGSKHPSTLDTTLVWTRRSRTGVEPFSGVATPLGETSEAYEVEIWDSGFTTLKRTISGLTSPSCTYTSAQQVEDFGVEQNTVYVRIYQLSSIVGRGYVLQGSFTYAQPSTATPRMLIHFEGGAFTDEAGHAITAYNSAAISTTQKYLGASSGYFPGGTSYIEMASSTDFDIGAGAFTFEAQVYPTSDLTSDRVIFARLSATYGIAYEHAIMLNKNYIAFYYGIRGTNQAHIRLMFPSALPVNAWTRIIIQRNGAGEWSAYLGNARTTQYQVSPLGSGVSFGSVTTGTYTNAVNLGSGNNLPCKIGGAPTAGTYFPGYVDEVRLILSEAIYSTSTIPPQTDQHPYP